MKQVARVVGILLILAIVPSLVSLQPASSQSFTTITSLETITTEATVTRLSTMTTQTTNFVTFTTTQFTTSTMAQPRKIVYQPFTLTAPGQEYRCVYSAGLLAGFIAHAGEVLAGTLSSDSEISFFLMTSHDYDVWNSKDVCSVDSALVEAQAVKTYSFEFVIPNDDRYRFLVENYSHENDAKVEITAQIVGTATQSSTVATRTEIRQDYSTQTAVAPAIVTQTSTSLRTEQVAGGGFSLEGSNMLLMVAGIVVGVAVVVGVFVLRGRRGKAKAGTKMYAEPEEEPSPPAVATVPPPIEPVAPPRPSRAPPPGMKFCVHCGEPIPRNAQFCTKIKCGKPQN